MIFPLSDLHFHTDLSEGYRSASQKARLLTETWGGEHIFCPGCAGKLFHHKNNKPVADFFCASCQYDFELKSQQKAIGEKVQGGAWQKMIDRITSLQNPHFFFLAYQNDCVKDLILVPRYFFTPDIIEKRKPLSEKARRAGWTGCNILLGKIPQSGRIFYIKDSQPKPQSEIITAFNKICFLKDIKPDLKGWTLDLMLCLEKLPEKSFTLKEAYQFEKILQEKHPDNHFIKDKIRQQLQYLRDKGFLEFRGKGIYEIR